LTLRGKRVIISVGGFSMEGRPKITCVEWVDPETNTGWMSLEEALKSATAAVVSVGLLLHEDEDFLWICMDWAKDFTTNTRGRISKKLITKRKDINLPTIIWKELKNARKTKKPTYISRTNTIIEEADRILNSPDAGTED
jgi:hypothetical protein